MAPRIQPTIVTDPICLRIHASATDVHPIGEIRFRTLDAAILFTKLRHIHSFTIECHCDECEAMHGHPPAR